MGRKARVNNGSPVDIALEKYHNEIGNRLSGVFLPPHPCVTSANKDNDTQNVSDAFSMLTLDLRKTKHAVNKSATLPQMGQKQNNEENKHKLFKSTCVLENHDDFRSSNSKACDSAFVHSNDSSRSNSATRAEHGSDSTKDKKNFIDKLRLARSIFQRKHTCARCQRRSRSCIQNKTFNLNGKHYMCGQCREARRAIKDLVIAGNASKLDDVSKNNGDIILPKPRLHLKESGYETATSCSTVASAHSNTSSPFTSSNRQNHKKLPEHVNDTPTNYSNTEPTQPETVLQIHNVNNGTSTYSDQLDHHHVPPNYYEHVLPCHNALHSSSQNQNNNAFPPEYQTSVLQHGPQTSHPNHTSTTQHLHQFMVTVNEINAPFLKQVKTRHVPEYDGYMNLDNMMNKNNAVKINPHVSDNSCDVTCHHMCCENCDNKENNNGNVQLNHEFNSCCDANRDDKLDIDKSTDEINDGVNYKIGDKMACYVCGSDSRPCFRLPWQGGWLCEDCIDGML